MNIRRSFFYRNNKIIWQVLKKSLMKYFYKLKWMMRITIWLILEWPCKRPKLSKFRQERIFDKILSLSHKKLYKMTDPKPLRRLIISQMINSLRLEHSVTASAYHRTNRCQLQNSLWTLQQCRVTTATQRQTNRQKCVKDAYLTLPGTCTKHTMTFHLKQFTGEGQFKVNFL